MLFRSPNLFIRSFSLFIVIVLPLGLKPVVLCHSFSVFAAGAEAGNYWFATEAEFRSWFIGMSSSKLRFEKLGEENYSFWKVYMEAVLVRKQLMEVVNGSKAMPGGPTGSKAVVAFKCAQAEAHTEIILCLEPSQLPHAHSLDPKIIWDELDAVHHSRGFAT